MQVKQLTWFSPCVVFPHSLEPASSLSEHQLARWWILTFHLLLKESSFPKLPCCLSVPPPFLQMHQRRSLIYWFTWTSNIDLSPLITSFSPLHTDVKSPFNLSPPWHSFHPLVVDSSTSPPPVDACRWALAIQAARKFRDRTHKACSTTSQGGSSGRIFLFTGPSK